MIESRGERGTPQVVERWGDPVSSKCVLAASFDDRKKDPVCVALPSFLSLLLFLAETCKSMPFSMFIFLGFFFFLAELKCHRLVAMLVIHMWWTY